MHTNHHPPTRPGSGIGKGDSGNGRVEAHRICTSSKRSQVTMELCRWIMHGAVARIQTTGMPPLPLPKAFSKAVGALAISKARGVVFKGVSKGKDTRTEPTDMVLGVALALGGGAS